MKQQAQTVLEALNVRDSILNSLPIILCTFTFLLGSAQNKKEDTYIKKELAKSGAYLNISLIDKVNKNDTLIGFIRINGVYLDLQSDNKNFLVEVSPGKYVVESFYFSKSPGKTKKIKVQNKDSLIVKIFMSDDTNTIE